MYQFLKSRATLVGVLVVLAVTAQIHIPLAQDAANPSATSYSTDTDFASYVVKAPGRPSGSSFAKFANEESVSLFNGNLSMAHPSSPKFALDGGGSIGLVRHYNSKTSRMDLVKWFDPVPGHPEEPLGGYRQIYHGHSWAGDGWTMHLGRLYYEPFTNFGSSGRNSGRKLKFESPDGTQTMLEPFQTEDGAILEFNSFDDQICEGLPPCSRPQQCCGDEIPFLPDPDPGMCAAVLENCTCEDNCRARSGYKVTFPSGTTYYLEKMVDEELIWGEWITNYDQAGWYTTEIRDVHGNHVWIEYHGEGRHPEAIKSITIEPRNGPKRKVIETMLYPEVPETDPEYHLRGKLKELRALGPNDDPAADSSTWKTIYRFEYEQSTNGDFATPSRRIGARLIRVTLPESAGTVEYDYVQVQNAFIHNSNTSMNVSGIKYPTGAYSEYSYDLYQMGNRTMDCTQANEWDPTGELCDEQKRRWATGIVKRTIWPDGKDLVGSNRHATTVWERRNWGVDYQRDSSANEFIVRNPDGTSTLSVMYGLAHTCLDHDLDCPDGREKSRVLRDPLGQEVRRVEYDYLAGEYKRHYLNGGTSGAFDGYQIGTRLKERRTYYLDDAGVASGGGFESPGTGTVRFSSVTNSERDAHHRWKVVRQEGSYLRTPRSTYLNYEDPDDLGSCRIVRHIHGAYDLKVVEDAVLSGAGVPDEVAAKRLETHYDYDCDGQLVALRQNRSYSTPAADFPSPTTASADTGHVRHELDYDAEGNLSDIRYYGGDCDGLPGCGTSAEYSAELVWENGRAISAKLASLDYYTQEVAIDDAGYVSSTTDPNGLSSTVEYDGLGRAVKIRPPAGSGEHAATIDYPTLNQTRISSSPSGSAAYNQSDSGQRYTEQRYDGLGRTTEVYRAMPDPSGGRLVKRIIRYDEMGREVFRSTWLPENTCESGSAVTCVTWEAEPRDLDGDGTLEGAFWVDGIPLGQTGYPIGSVTFYGLPDPSDPYNPLKATADALGRVREVLAADGTRKQKNYCGPHEEVRITGIQGALDGSTIESVTRLYRDGHGRLVVVDADASAGTSGAGVDAAYEYDLRGELVRVNLVEDLGSSDPFGDWKAGSFWHQGQLRRFEYNALGRLIESERPEDGLKSFEAYDVLGNLLRWTDARGIEEGYHFENEYEEQNGSGTGRLIRTTKILDGGTATGNWDSPEAFDSLSGWTEGTFDGETFTAGPTLWRSASYKASESDGTIGRCVVGTSHSSTGTSGLYFGADDCSYESAPASSQLVCRDFASLRRDDRIEALFWRHVRENTTPGDGSADELAIWVLPTSGDFSDKRVALQLSEAQASLKRWRRVPHVPLGSLFSRGEWAPGTTKSLQVCIAFTREDLGSTGLGVGVALDNFRIGRPASQVLVEKAYDADICASGGSDACVTGTSNSVNGQLTSVTSYQDGVVLGTRRWVYQGLNGRVSGVDQSVDWAGVGEAFPSERWTWTINYDAYGQPAELDAPYRPSVDQARIYGSSHSRGYLVDLHRSVAGSETSFLGDGGVAYNDAGALLELHFANGTKQTIARDSLSRPDSITSEGPAGVLWASGKYAYDGAGNIKAIGEQSYAYDSVGRLIEASVTEQAALAHLDANARPQQNLQYTYDAFGNLEQRTLVSDGVPKDGLEFSFTHYDASKGEGPTDTKNQVVHPQFTYDANGNMRRFTGKAGAEHQVGAAWDENNRMRLFFEGDPEAGGYPAEQYAYDAAGFRITQVGRTGVPRISLRNAAGQALSEYVVDHAEPGAPLRLDRDFIYGAGQLLVERVVSSAPPSMTSAVSSASGTQSFEVSAGAESDAVFTAEISTASGFRNLVSGLTLDSNDRFTLAEDELSPGETNYVQIRREDGVGSALSAPVTVVFDTTVTSTSENQVRALGASWQGTNIIVRWQLLEQNGKPTRLLFRDGVTGLVTVLTPISLPAGTESLVLASQALQAPCGSFEAQQQNLNGSFTGSSVGGELGSPAGGGIQNIGGCGSGGSSPPPAEGYSFAESFHHRDHLGSLRIAATESGNVEPNGRVDLYPFGIRMGNGDPDGSRRLYTGHERDSGTDLDYMLARYDSGSLGRFLTIDPGNDVRPNRPEKWNLYSYVSNNPLIRVDPTGMIENQRGNTSEDEGGTVHNDNGTANVTSPESTSPGETQRDEVITVVAQEEAGDSWDAIAEFLREHPELLDSDVIYWTGEGSDPVTHGDQSGTLSTLLGGESVTLTIIEGPLTTEEANALNTAEGVRNTVLITGASMLAGGGVGALALRGGATALRATQIGSATGTATGAGLGIADAVATDTYQRGDFLVHTTTVTPDRDQDIGLSYDDRGWHIQPEGNGN